MQTESHNKKTMSSVIKLEASKGKTNFKSMQLQKESESI